MKLRLDPLGAFLLGKQKETVQESNLCFTQHVLIFWVWVSQGFPTEVSKSLAFGGADQEDQGNTHTGGAPWQWVSSKALMWDSPFYSPFGGLCFTGPHLPNTLGGQQTSWLWGWTMASGPQVPFSRTVHPTEQSNPSPETQRWL